MSSAESCPIITVVPTFLILDTFNFLHRAYHAFPDTFKDRDGNPTNAVYGVSSMLLNVLTKYQLEYVAAAFESKEKENFRAAEFVGYKAHRPEMEDNLRVQIPLVEKVFDAVGVKRLTLEGFEADDVIGCLSKLPATTSPTALTPLTTLIVSNDQDMLQLVNSQVKVLAPGLGAIKEALYDEAAVVAKYGFRPAQMVDYKALRGDPSDNIPGVFGIGEKTAKDLIKQFGTVEEIYKNLDKVERLSVRTKLAEGAEIAMQSKYLATIKCDLPIPVTLEDLLLPPDWKQRASVIFQELGFKSLVSRLSNSLISPIAPITPEGQLELL